MVGGFPGDPFPPNLPFPSNTPHVIETHITCVSQHVIEDLRGPCPRCAALEAFLDGFVQGTQDPQIRLFLLAFKRKLEQVHGRKSEEEEGKRDKP